MSSRTLLASGDGLLRLGTPDDNDQTRNYDETCHKFLIVIFALLTSFSLSPSAPFWFLIILYCVAFPCVIMIGSTRKVYGAIRYAWGDDTGGEGTVTLKVKAKDSDATTTGYGSTPSSTIEVEEDLPVSKLEDGVLIQRYDYEDPSCSICLCEYELGEKILRLPCGHIYHESCISEWTDSHNRCPLCNYELQIGFKRPLFWKLLRC